MASHLMREEVRTFHSAACSRVLPVRWGPSRVARIFFELDEEELCVPAVLLRVVEAFRGDTPFDDVESGQEGPQRFTEEPSSSILFKHLWDKILLFEPACNIRGLRSLPLRLRSRPTFRGVSCARLTSASAPASSSRKDSAVRSLVGNGNARARACPRSLVRA